jgi:polysaccharide pyruvyl transferase WcaK-like protein
MARVLILPGDVRYNLGDTAICLGAIELVRRIAPGARISVWGRRPIYAGGFEEVSFCERVGGALWREAEASDAVLWGGGQLLQGNRSRLKLPYWAARIGFVRSAGAVVVGFGQGVGPLPRAFDRRLTAMIVRASRAFSVRDQDSFRLLEDCGVPRHLLRLTADPALLFDPPVTSERSSGDPPATNERASGDPPATNERANDRPTIGISLRYTGHHTASRIVPFQLRGKGARRRAFEGEEFARYRAGFVELADRLIEELDVDLVTVPMYLAPWATAEILAEAVATDVRRPERVRVFRPRTSLAELTATLRGLDAFIGTPMHSTILATSQGVPTLALPYEPKGREYMHRLGLGRCAVPLAELGESGGVSQIFDRVRAFWAERDGIRTELAREVPKLRRWAEANGEPVRQVLDLGPPPGEHIRSLEEGGA